MTPIAPLWMHADGRPTTSSRIERMSLIPVWQADRKASRTPLSSWRWMSSRNDNGSSST